MSVSAQDNIRIEAILSPSCLLFRQEVFFKSSLLINSPILLSYGNLRGHVRT